MRTVFPSLLTLGLLLAAGERARAQDDVRAIVQKALKAHGGAEKLDKFKAGQIKTKGKIELFDGLPFTQEITYQLPNQFKEVTDLEVMGQKVAVTTGFDGQKGWLEVNGQAQELDDKLLTELKEAAHMLRVSRLTSLLEDQALKLSSLGEVKVEGKAATGVRVEAKGFRDISLFFDKDSGLLVKTERRAVDPMTGQEFTEERIITEYQKVEGLPSPKKAIVNRDGKKFLEAEVTEIKLLEKVDAQTFAKPQ
jgi:hypothetical protein